MLTHPHIVLTLRRHHLFSQLPEKTFQDVCTLASLKRLPNHTPLMHQGDAADRFFLLVSGQIKLHRVTGEGQEHLVEVIQPGQTFAEALLFTQAKAYPVSATALKDSVLVSIEGQHYRRALEDQPKICLAILASMITPGDAITATIILMGPLLLLYELSIILAKLVERNRLRAAAEADAVAEAG